MEYLDKYNGDYQSQQVMHKLARALGMLSKGRHYVQKKELKISTMLYLKLIFDTDDKSGCYPALKPLRIKLKNYRKRHFA